MLFFAANYTFFKREEERETQIVVSPGSGEVGDMKKKNRRKVGKEAKDGLASFLSLLLCFPLLPPLRWPAAVSAAGKLLTLAST